MFTGAAVIVSLTRKLITSGPTHTHLPKVEDAVRSPNAR
jgi:hypothetical protein